MSYEAVSWAMDDAPMLRTKRGRDGTSRSVLVVLAERADRFGRNSYPSLADICFRTGWDRSTVQRALRRLEGEALIVRQGVTRDGCTRWSLSMDLRRPDSDRQEVESEEDAFRAATAERKRRSRATVTHSKGVTVTHSESVTDADVTPLECVTDADVTPLECVTDADVTPLECVTEEDVTHSKSGRHALGVRDTADVTHSKSGRHALNAARTTLEPPIELTTHEPPIETPPPSESPRDAVTETHPKPASTKGTRLPADFPVTAEMANWAREKTPLCGPEDHEAFCDYWHGLAGPRALKVDWVATWRNWMRKEQKSRARLQNTNGSSRRPNPDERAAAIQALKLDFANPQERPLNLIRGEIA